MTTKSLNKQAVLICGVFIIAMASGVMLGNGLARKQTVEANPVPPTFERDPSKRLAMELGLSSAQIEQQKQIFDKAREKGKGQDERIAAMNKARSEAIAELLSPEQKTKYDAIQDAHKKAWEALGKERFDAFAAAQEEFKAILTSEQRAKYEEILKARPPGGDRGRRGSSTNPSTTTAPSTSTAPAAN